MFVINRTKIFLAATLVATWWFSFLLPHYTPAIQSAVNTRLEQARQKIPNFKIDWRPQPAYDPRDDYDPSKVVLIIEPRALPHLVPQLLHMMFLVPPEWRFVFIGTANSVATMGRIMSIRHQQVIGKLDLMVLPEPWEIDTKEKTYRLLTDIRFYDEFLPGVEYILKYEHDSILCANSQVSVNEWLEWSWAGAQATPNDRFAGNGGLTFRRVSAIRKILRFQQRFNDSQPEDQWFGNRLWVLPGEKVAGKEEGIFAVEGVYTKNPMGFHIKNGKELPPVVWQDPVQRKEIFDYCPELSLIMDMKLEVHRCPGDNKKGSIDEAEKKKHDEAEAKKKADEEAKKKAAEDAAKKAADEAAKKVAEEAAKKKAAEEAAKNPASSSEQPKPTGAADPIKEGEEARLKAEEAAKKADEEAKKANPV